MSKIKQTWRDSKAFLDKSRDFSFVNLRKEVPRDTIFSWYVPGKDRDFTSSDFFNATKQTHTHTHTKSVKIIANYHSPLART